MMKRLTTGQWTLRDMREQFQAVLKMGPLGNIMNQFPGMSGLDFHESGAPDRAEPAPWPCLSAPPADLGRPKAWGSPTHPLAPPQQLGGVPRPQLLASACASDEVLSPRLHRQACASRSG